MLLRSCDVFHVFCRAVFAVHVREDHTVNWNQHVLWQDTTRGKFPSAKKYHNCAFKYILEVVQGEIKKQ
jgi:hypothetical protein